MGGSEDDVFWTGRRKLISLVAGSSAAFATTIGVFLQQTYESSKAINQVEQKADEDQIIDRLVERESDIFEFNPRELEVEIYKENGSFSPTAELRIDMETLENDCGDMYWQLQNNEEHVDDLAAAFDALVSGVVPERPLEHYMLQIEGSAETGDFEYEIDVDEVQRLQGKGLSGEEIYMRTKDRLSSEYDCL